MTKRPRTLSAAFVRTISRPGVYGDGRGLSLRVHRTATGRITKTWRQRVRIEGRLISIGLGPYPEITLAHRADNPVDRAVVALPRANGNAPRHYRALPHREIAAALGAIRRVKYIHPSAVLCVEMIALTAVRAGEARGARWNEIGLEAARWTIPASRMKTGREFSVPLSTSALGVLVRAQSPESSLVFPSRTGGPLPVNAPGRVLRRAGVASTVHGFRSSGRGWRNRVSLRKSRRPASPMSRGAGSCRRTSDPTCWSVAPKSCKPVATTSHSAGRRAG